jgi:glycosyltransferase involved in cell wall biosynthesis
MNSLVSVVVPFYNEEENVPLMAARIAEVFSAIPGRAYECVFVNDGSNDGTRAALEALQAHDPHVRAVHFHENCGQSAALIAGLRLAGGEFILTFDGDLQNDPADIPRMLELLEQFDCVCGYRANRQDTWVRRMSSRYANKVRQRILHDGIRDTGCGTKGFRRVCVQHFVCFNGMHRYFAVMVRAAGLTIAECPVSHHPRVHGTSKYGIHNRLWRGIYDLVGVRWLQKRYVTYRIDGEQ